ncbi:MAG: diadenylate cyclase CdaA [Phycisphaeraceae bacterium]|nr:diadenylate cyclase CdaA [Phycisphaeraceae bacterium]
MQYERLSQLVNRLQTYNPLVMLVELAVIWLVVYLVLRFLRGTRGARVIKGVALLLIIGTLLIQVLGTGHFARLSFLYTNFLEFLSLALIIVFQPELRRALVRLGETRFFFTGGLRKARAIEEVLSAVQYMSDAKVGALIAIERQVGLNEIVAAGTRLDATVSEELLNTIFWPGSALHDMGVIIRGDRVIAAGVQFPLAEGEQLPQELGSRHRAALGLSQESDALVLVVSEETGTISLAQRGTLRRELDIDELRTMLVRGLDEVQVPISGESAEAAAAEAGGD